MSINKFKIGWKFEEGKKPYHQAPTVTLMVNA